MVWKEESDNSLYHEQRMAVASVQRAPGGTHEQCVILTLLSTRAKKSYHPTRQLRNKTSAQTMVWYTAQRILQRNIRTGVSMLWELLWNSDYITVFSRLHGLITSVAVRFSSWTSPVPWLGRWVPLCLPRPRSPMYSSVGGNMWKSKAKPQITFRWTRKEIQKHTSPSLRHRSWRDAGWAEEYIPSPWET